MGGGLNYKFFWNKNPSKKSDNDVAMGLDDERGGVIQRYHRASTARKLRHGKIVELAEARAAATSFYWVYELFCSSK